MQFIIGMAGSLFSIVVFLLGFYLGQRTAQPVKKPAETPVNDAEIAKMKKERENLEAEQRAFRNLVGYSADIAYGLERFPTESDVA